jgi:putative transposase
MARLGRFFIEGQPLHDRAPVFFADDDYAQYRQWLIAAAEDYGLIVHAHVFMTNHVHLLVTPQTAESLPRTMQSLGRRYVRYVNALYRRTGTLWEGRYRAAPIDSEEYFVASCRYIELNPVRARMVAHPRQYRWSSYRAHAEGADDALARFHDAFRRLGRSVAERQAAYRALIRETLDPAFVDALRDATNGGWALGGERFRKQAAAASHRRAAPLPPGPKPKAKKDARQMRLL